MREPESEAGERGWLIGGLSKKVGADLAAVVATPGGPAALDETGQAAAQFLERQGLIGSDPNPIRQVACEWNTGARFR